MQENDFWQIEQACRDAWPAVREEEDNGWVLRLSGGKTRRTNSVNALPGATSVHDVLPAATAFYDRFEQPVLFRTLSFQPQFEAELEAAGFRDQGETVCTLRAPLRQSAKPALPAVDLSLVPSPEWVADKLRLTPMVPRQQRAYRFMLHHLQVPAAFARISNGDAGLSVAYGALSQDLLIIESVVTDPDHRGQGLAQATAGALMTWGAKAGAKAACLQVVADNAAGHALYAKLGFSEELYRYNYWQLPE